MRLLTMIVTSRNIERVRKQDSVTASVPEPPLAPNHKTKGKQKSPAQRKRDRESLNNK